MRIIIGNLIKLARKCKFDIITHGCNCHCLMKKGIAPQIRKAFKSAWEADRNTLDGYEGKLGKISVGFEVAANGEDLMVINSYTQFNHRPPDVPKGTVVYVNYDAVRSCFKTIAERAVEWFPEKPKSEITIGYPKIGCGEAGGDWNVISSIIDEELLGFNHMLVMMPQQPVD